jgi:Uma2 family endonuclease
MSDKRRQPPTDDTFVTVPVRLHRYSFRDYLAVEEDSGVKHEFLDGEIYAMAGGTMLHAALSASVLASLHAQLAGPCRVYGSDLRIRVAATGLASYPDVTVVCGPAEADPENKDTVTNPTLVVEVLSPSTIDYDLGEKFEHYRQISSLRTVVYVWQDQRRIEVRTRDDDGAWRSEISEAGGRAATAAPAAVLDVDALFLDAGAQS